MQLRQVLAALPVHCYSLLIMIPFENLPDRNEAIHIQVMRKLIPALFILCLVLASTAAAAVEKVVIVGLFKDKAVVLLDGKRRILAVGKTSREGARLISADSETAVIEIDGETRTYKLGSHIGSTFAAAPEGASVRIWADTMGMFSIEGNINGFPVNFLVDTGATLIAMNENEARRLGLDYRIEGREGIVNTASGTSRAWYVVLRKVRVGDITLQNVDAAVVDGDYPRQVLLGMSFLGQLKMERSGKVLELRKKP